MSSHHDLDREVDFFKIWMHRNSLLRSPVVFITAGTAELKAALLWDRETLNSVICYLIFSFFIGAFMKINTYFKTNISKKVIVKVKKCHSGWSLGKGWDSPSCSCPTQAIQAMPVGSQVMQLAWCSL